MKQKVNIGLIDSNRDRLSNMVLDTKSKLNDCSYVDLRIRVSEGQQAIAQDGMMKSSVRDYDLSYGLRVIAGKDILAPGYFGETLGAADVDGLPDVIRGGLRQAYERAIANSAIKNERKKRWGALGQSLRGSELAPVKAYQDTIKGDSQ